MHCDIEILEDRSVNEIKRFFHNLSKKYERKGNGSNYVAIFAAGHGDTDKDNCHYIIADEEDESGKLYFDYLTSLFTLPCHSSTSPKKDRTNLSIPFAGVPKILFTQSCRSECYQTRLQKDSNGQENAACRSACLIDADYICISAEEKCALPRSPCEGSLMIKEFTDTIKEHYRTMDVVSMYYLVNSKLQNIKDLKDDFGNDGGCSLQCRINLSGPVMLL